MNIKKGNLVVNIKKFIILILVLALPVSLVSCSKMVTGKYSATFLGVETTFEFGVLGSVTKTTVIPKTIFTDEETVVKKGKYEIMEDNENPEKLVIAFEFEDEERVTYSFSQGEIDGEKIIIIAGVEFSKVK